MSQQAEKSTIVTGDLVTENTGLVPRTWYRGVFIASHRDWPTATLAHGYMHWMIRTGKQDDLFWARWNWADAKLPWIGIPQLARVTTTDDFGSVGAAAFAMCGPCFMECAGGHTPAGWTSYGNVVGRFRDREAMFAYICYQCGATFSQNEPMGELHTLRVYVAEWCSFCDTLTTDMVLHNLRHDLAEARTAIHSAYALGPLVRDEHGVSLDRLAAHATNIQRAIRNHKKLPHTPPEENSLESMSEKGLSRAEEQGIVESGSVK